MKRTLVVAGIVQMLCAGVAFAQVEGSPIGDRVYVQATGVGAIGRPSLGAEGGVRLVSGLALIGSAGQIGAFDATRLLQPDPAMIRVAPLLKSHVNMSVDVAGTFAAGGFRYDLGSRRWHLRPYVLAVGGVAQLHQAVRFRLPLGRDVTMPVIRFDLLGHDPSGDVTAPMAAAGVGVMVPVQHLRLDVGYRYQQFMTAGAPVRTGSLMLGVGVRF